jgi:hypothetical protein
MNSLRGRWENFWSSEQTSVVRLEMVYALTNPAKDDLVDAAEDWPGINAFASITNGKDMTATPPPSAPPRLIAGATGRARRAGRSIFDV